jgi:peroxiredoxin
MKAWAETALGVSWRQSVLRAALALVLLGALLWALPTRRAGEEGGHHGAHDVRLDLFEKAGVTELKEGQRGPAFTLPLFTGGEASLATWRDKLVVLNFWATWCTPCTIEMPSLEALWRDYKDRGLVVVGVSVDRGAPRTLIAPYLENLHLTFPILLDGQMETANAWRVPGVPATFVIRPGGDVVGMAIGMREWNGAPMRALLESLLPPSPPGRSSRPGQAVALLQDARGACQGRALLPTYSLRQPPNTSRRTSTNPLVPMASTMVSGGTHVAMVSQ